LKLSSLIANAGVIELAGSPDPEITSVEYDSRRVAPGSLFAAIRGVRQDGTRFIPAAIEKGASAVMFEEFSGERPTDTVFVRVADARRAMALAAAEFYGHPSESLKVIGVTGTNGKTTTSYLIKAMVEAGGGKAGLLGTIAYLVGDRTLPAPNTTPESVDLQRLLAEMLSSGATHAAIEVSSHSLSLYRVAGCRFAVKVFTNFTQDHLDFHGDMDEYYAAKKGLFTSGGGVSVLNLDDPKGWDLAVSADGPVISYGINAAADLTASDIRLTAGGMAFRLTAPTGEIEVVSPLTGRHNVYNVLAAAGAAVALGLGLDAVTRGAANMSGVPGRFERVEAGQGFTVLVDYAHTDDALARAITACREFTAGRVITLFGCGGDRDKGKRPKMGYAASLLSDIIVLTSDNPRSEDPMSIIAEVEAGITEEGSKERGKGYFVAPDRAEAIRLAVGMANPGDTVLLAGKGHEDYQITGADKRHFDDREVAKEAIGRLLNK